LDIGLIPLFYHGAVETVIEVIAACARGGARAIEFTNRGELAYPVFTELVKHFAETDPSIILGIGSIMDAPTAALYLASGANFIVGPSFNPEIARLCNRRRYFTSPVRPLRPRLRQRKNSARKSARCFPATR
jgi:2-dehydro-3-deoxyphosphogluconate aldolase/(4S)-4-hydroxy-2-oxoglutarate aldolase